MSQTDRHVTQEDTSQRCEVRNALTGPLLLRVAGRVVAVRVQRLRPLLTGRIAGLVGMPGLFAVVAELGTAAVSATNQPGAAGAARGDDGEAARKSEVTSEIRHTAASKPVAAFFQMNVIKGPH